MSATSKEGEANRSGNPTPSSVNAGGGAAPGGSILRKNAPGSRGDVAWKHGVSVDGDARKIQCKYCGSMEFLEIEMNTPNEGLGHDGNDGAAAATTSFVEIPPIEFDDDLDVDVDGVEDDDEDHIEDDYYNQNLKDLLEC